MSLGFASGPLAATIALIAGQSTLILLVATLVDRTLQGRPARRHRALILAIAACFVAPAATAGARSLGLGLIAASGPDRSRAAGSGRAPAPLPGPAAVGPTRPRDLPPAAPTMGDPIAPPPTVRAVWPARVGMAAGTVLAIAWAGSSGLCLVRLLGSFAAGRRLVRRAAPPGRTRLGEVVAEVVARGGVSVDPRVLVSPEVACPVIWCWGRRPALILPGSLDRAGSTAATAVHSDLGLAAVIGHELAHCERRDHWAGLLAELLICAIPWQPLAWWAGRRRAELAELACDDRVRATLGPGGAADYAEALLGWAADRRRFPILAAVWRRSGLVARVHQILEGAAPMPHPGRSWTSCALAAAASLVAALALAQPRASSAPAAMVAPALAPEPEGMMADAPASLVAIEGTVATPAGAPIAGVEVVVLDFEPPVVDPVGRFDPAWVMPPQRVTARGLSDAAGRFALRVPSHPDRADDFPQLLARRDGLAPGMATILPNRLVRIVLDAPVPIRGHLLRPDGTPAPGVRVRLERYTADPDDDDLDNREFAFPAADHRNGHPRDEWPAGFIPDDYRTDADGRFTIDGFVPSGMFATMGIDSPDWTAEELVVSTRADTKPTPALVAFEITPLPSDFAHTLRPARPVVGTIRAAATGRPVAGVAVEVIPMGRHGGMQVQTTTDAEGRYRVADREGETYSVTAYPAPGSGLIAQHRGMLRWPDGAGELRVDIALRSGVAIRGRVVDEATGRPIPSAAVVYQPLDSNPTAQPEDEYRVTSRTDLDGRFTVTGLAGAGVVGVDGPDQGFIRTAHDLDLLRDDQQPRPHGLARLDLPAAGDPAEVVVRLRRGIVLESLATLPDGSAAEYVRAWCPELSARLLDNQFNPVAFLGGRFRLPGAEPGRIYRVVLLADHARAGAVAELRADPAAPGPIAVRLGATATVTGRLVDGVGQPLRDTPVYARLDYLDRRDRLTWWDLNDELMMPLQLNLTQGFGEPEPRPLFRLDGLIPGLGYVLTWTDGIPPDHERHRVVAPLAPGEVRALGDLPPGPVLKPGR